jgi:hypothetical protein
MRGINHSGIIVKELAYTKGWEINPDNIPESSSLVKFLGIQWYGGLLSYPSKVKGKLLCLDPGTTKKEAQMPSGPICIFEEAHSLIACIILVHMQSDPKSCKFYVRPRTKGSE